MGSTIFHFCPTSTDAIIHGMQFDAMEFSTNIASQYQNVTYNGDLLVSNNQTFTIQNSEFLMNGTITVEDTSTLIIRNSKFTTVPSRDSPLGRGSIIMANEANLNITNATVIFKHPDNFECEIIAYDYTRATITNSTFQNRGFVTGNDKSVIHVSNSTMHTEQDYHYTIGVATFDDSTTEIETSVMDGVFIWDGSTANIKDSDVGLVRTGGTTRIDIATSKINQIETFHAIEGARATTIHVEDSTVKRLNVQNANVLLVDCHFGSVEARDNATVFVGWNLPLFGLVKMPHTWIPYVQLTIIVVISVIVVTVLLALLRKKVRTKVDTLPNSTES